MVDSHKCASCPTIFFFRVCEICRMLVKLMCACKFKSFESIFEEKSILLRKFRGDSARVGIIERSSSSLYI